MVTKLKRGVYLDFAKRLIEAWDKSDYQPKSGQQGFTKALGALADVGYKGAEKWVKGDGLPDMGNAVILAKKLGVSFEWLMLGGSSPYTSRTAHAVQESSGPDYQKKPPEEAVIIGRKIAKLPNHLQTAIIQIINTLVESNSET
jgi:hypothetical protein